MKIRIKDTQKKITINKKLIRHLAGQILTIKGEGNSELSIFFVGASRIRALNEEFRKTDRPTDCLAFSMREGKKGGNPALLGDVVICPEMARQAAGIYKTTIEQEIYLYLIHGILHLLGYDDVNTKSRAIMEKEQARILTSLTSLRP